MILISLIASCVVYLLSLPYLVQRSCGGGTSHYSTLIMQIKCKHSRTVIVYQQTRQSVLKVIMIMCG